MFPLDKDLHGCRLTGSYPETGFGVITRRTASAASHFSQADFGPGTICEEMRKIAQDESILLILAA